MNRRTFVLLSGAASGGLFDPGRWLRVATRDIPPAVGGLRFTCDERQRWTLSYHGDGVPVPLIADAEMAVRVGDRVVALHLLEGVAARRQIGSDRHVLVVSGTTAGIAIEVTFFDAAPGESAAITVNVSPDRIRATVPGIQYFTLPAENVLPGPGGLQALINGYHSWSESLVTEITPDTEQVSHAALGLWRRGRGLALVFDPGEPGEAAVHCARGTLEARSDWLPARPVKPDGDSATLRLAFDPGGDGFAALTRAYAPAPVDRDRFTAAAPAGWCSRSQLHDRVTEADVIANLDACATHFDARFVRYLQLDDGYQRSAGDWETNDKFPHGHRWLTDQIHARGLKAGLWIAPFAVTDRSGLPAAHPSWLVRQNDAPVSLGTNASWGGTVYALDAAHGAVQEWLRDLARRAVQEWGYDFLKLDFLLYATAGEAHAGGATHAEAYRTGLAAIRDGMGTEAFLLACGAPLQHAVGAVNGMRIGSDVDATWEGIQSPARAAGLRGFYHRGVWFNDPDCLVVRPPLSIDEARVWTAIVALSGGVTLLSDDLPRLPPDRLALLQRALPVAPISVRTGPADRAPSEIAPAIHAAEIDPVPLRGGWRFQVGDDVRWAQPQFDDSAWHSSMVPRTWEQSGHPELDGYAWYRTRFRLPVPSPERTGGRAFPATLELGRIDDADETFLNGIRIGQSGSFPPEFRSERQTLRRYAIPEGVLRWGDVNTLAIRVYDGGGNGGFWETQRDLPPDVWVAEGVPGWWTIALVNWRDEPDSIAVPLRRLGMSAGPFAVYDVWSDAPRSDATDRIVADLGPHASVVLALRPAVLHPQVVGTTRHVVQGAIDVASEAWDRKARVLEVTSKHLDARPYAVTIAVPPGLEPDALTCEVTGTVRKLRSNHVIVEWQNGTNGRDIDWRLSFKRP